MSDFWEILRSRHLCYGQNVNCSKFDGRAKRMLHPTSQDGMPLRALPETVRGLWENEQTTVQVRRRRFVARRAGGGGGRGGTRARPTLRAARVRPSPAARA